MKKEEETDIVFQDELDDERFKNNARTLFLILLRELTEHKSITLRDYNAKVVEILSKNVFSNGDYYTFLVHLCEKTEYLLTDGQGMEETFLDALIKEYMSEPEFAPYSGIHFYLELAGGNEEELQLSEYASVTDFTIKL